MGKRDLEQALMGKVPNISGELGESLGKHNDPDKARYYGQFHKTAFVSLKYMQTFRLVTALALNTPLWLVAILVQGVDYFIMYAT